MFNLELVNYLLTTIRGIYTSFDPCHDENHFDEVVSSTLEMCSYSEFDSATTEKMLIAAAFHDVGRLISDDDHEANSCIILRNDKWMRRHYSTEDIEWICDVIYQHRSKIKNPTTEYAAILKDADKMSRLNKKRCLFRVLSYQVYYTDLKGDDLVNRVKDVCAIKFEGLNWYSKAANYLYNGKEIPVKDLQDDKYIMNMISTYPKDMLPLGRKLIESE